MGKMSGRYVHQKEMAKTSSRGSANRQDVRRIRNDIGAIRSVQVICYEIKIVESVISIHESSSCYSYTIINVPKLSTCLHEKNEMILAQ